ncbi:predicted protein [Naegleria gruberi]|uniref:Predicted protein n=1 Tax=Naegleria gruberi TaxID=5762 RepID=D2VST2_NAEGR|nr:uncharacterized protein NAEGRDRAFT_51977 [Naegleria gruberi]EFC40173.1 predicted protein [Naegleria gruberi]|eukprot:XP_002672917.1 predicted protein [Naegleria gruberi strain NEG-M]
MAKEDSKNLSTATVMFIGDCPGVGKSRFAYELPGFLKHKFNSPLRYHFVNLAIWFNSGYNPTIEEAKDNLIISTAARMIFSYITHVRSHSYNGKIMDELTSLAFYREIYNDLQRSVYPNDQTLVNVISWIIRRESNFTDLPVWIHLTIDEYNQAFQYITDISIIDNWCIAISNIHQTVKFSRDLFTNLLTGTHVHTMMNLKSVESGGEAFLSRITISKFNKEENYLLYKQMKMPYEIKLLNAYLTMGGHARLCVEFIKEYRNTKSISATLKELQNVVGNRKQDRFQLNLNRDEIEFFLSLCFTGITISKDYVFNSTPILQYQKSNIVLMKQISTDQILIEIPLLIISVMLEKLSSSSFLNKLGNSFEHWETFNDNFDNFETFNQQLLETKLNCFQKLKALNVINEPITIKDLFTIDVDFHDYIIQLDNSTYSSVTLDKQYPITNGITLSPNIIYKNGKSAPFADLFSYLKVCKPDKSQTELFCYLQVKHTKKQAHIGFKDDIEPELKKLENQKEKLSSAPIFMLFISNRPHLQKQPLTNNYTQKYSVIYLDNGKRYFSPFSDLLNCNIGIELPIKELSVDNLKYILGRSCTKRKSFHFRTLVSAIGTANENEIATILVQFCDEEMLSSMLSFVKEKEIIKEALALLVQSN